MKIFQPTYEEYPDSPYFSRYINTVTDEDALNALRNQYKNILAMYDNLPEKIQNYAYAPNKWTVKELLGHMVDAERVFSYRAMCIARGEQQLLPGFDENSYMEFAHFSNRSLESILQEYKNLREANLALFESLTPAMLSKKGSANGNSVSVRALIWILAGHEQHHIHILQERYLSS